MGALYCRQLARQMTKLYSMKHRGLVRHRWGYSNASSRSALNNRLIYSRLNDRNSCGREGTGWNAGAIAAQGRSIHSGFVVAAGLSFGSDDITVDVGLMVEGTDVGNGLDMDALAESLSADAVRITQQAAVVLSRARVDDGEEIIDVPGPLEVSLVLCDDEYIRALNREWRNVDKATDVLAFEMGDDGEDLSCESECPLPFITDEESNDVPVMNASLPVVMLGDIVISIDTAKRQAEERGHSLLDECRILLVHGVLHLLGYDHEHGIEEAEEMHQAETFILKALGFDVESGLIGFGQAQDPIMRRNRSNTEIKLITIDMDGTLLDSNSQCLSSSVEAIRLALDRGVRVILATGKARPAAVKAMDKVGLAGDDLVVSSQTAGIFLQGLQVFGNKGQVIGGFTLDQSVLQTVLKYSIDNNISVCGFQGDACVTPFMTSDIELLHERYYEPLAAVQPSVDLIARGPPIYKLLLMSDKETIDAIRPHMDEEILRGHHATTMQAVETMLEIVPPGVNKWTALKVVSSHLDTPVDSIMAIGDGENDLEMITGAGLGIAMGNAVDKVKIAADHVVASNDEHGVFEAIEKFVLQ